MSETRAAYRERLRGVIAALPDAQKLAIELIEVQERSVLEAAAIMGQTVEEFDRILLAAVQAVRVGMGVTSGDPAGFAFRTRCET